MATTNYASRYKRNARKRNMNFLAVILLSGVAVVGALVLFVVIVGFMGVMAPEEPQPNLPVRLASKQIQQERLELIAKLHLQGIIQKVEGHRVYVSPGFYQITFDDKQGFISVCYAYMFQIPKGGSGNKDEMLWVHGGMNGKKIGSFMVTEWQAGLVLD